MIAFAPPNIVADFLASMEPIHNALSSKGVFTSEEIKPEAEEEIYKYVVRAQQKFEEGIVNGLDSKEILASVAIVHTGGPCNPLSYKINDRTPVLEDMLSAGGEIVCVYQDKNKLGETCPPDKKGEEYYKAKARYDALRNTFSNLQDVPVLDPEDNLTHDMSGASYLVMTKSEDVFFYSFQSFQNQTIGKNGARVWAIWAGKMPGLDATAQNKETKDAVWTRKQEVDLFLKSCSVNMDMLLKRKIGPNVMKRSKVPRLEQT